MTELSNIVRLMRLEERRELMNVIVEDELCDYQQCRDGVRISLDFVDVEILLVLINVCKMIML